MTGLFTVDSLWALAVAVGLVTVSIYIVSTPKVSYDEQMHQFSLDVLTVAEKKGYLEMAVEGEPMGLEKMRSQLPDDACFDLDIYDVNQEPVFHYSTQGCSEPKRSTLVKRSVVSDSGFYIASLRMWHGEQ